MEKYCSEEQKMKYLVPLAKGEVIGAFVCLSQKQEVMQLLKKRQQLIKGSFVKRYKNWITNGVLHQPI
jgi:alkylation response protein AidB-like acyl-CoA dehydrogenase